jgi:hypothetical protein
MCPAMPGVHEAWALEAVTKQVREELKGVSETFKSQTGMDDMA